ncbi:MAG: type II secretion system protein [Deltaproteobacteria bacterium]|nr:type II secretion system protein [Deltaproteobacteria bacterium]
MRRGFSLIEVMLVVVILGVAAALAIPNLLPEVRKAKVDSGAEAVASFLARARTEAMLSKRCVRAWVDSTDARRMSAERLNSFDCDVAAATFPSGYANGLDSSGTVWVPLGAAGTLLLESPRLTVSLFDAPASTSGCVAAIGSVSGTPAGHPCGEVVFRPNGRVWQQDGFIADPAAAPTDDDDAVFEVVHGDAPTEFRRVLVNSNGYICTLDRGAPLVADPNGDFQCTP